VGTAETIGHSTAMWLKNQDKDHAKHTAYKFITDSMVMLSIQLNDKMLCCISDNV